MNNFIINLCNLFYKKATELNQIPDKVKRSLSILGIVESIDTLTQDKVNKTLTSITRGGKLKQDQLEKLYDAADEVISFIKSKGVTKKTTKTPAKDKLENFFLFLKKFNSKITKTEVADYFVNVFSKTEINPDQVENCLIDPVLGLIFYGNGRSYLLTKYYRELSDYLLNTDVILAQKGIPLLYLNKMTSNFAAEKSIISSKILEDSLGDSKDGVDEGSDERSIASYPDLSQFYWIAGPIAKLTGFYSSEQVQPPGRIMIPRFIYLFKKFIESYGDKINEINQYRNIIQPEKIDSLSGSDGIAMSISEDKILKLHTSLDLFEKEKDLSLDIFYQDPEMVGTQTRVYDSGILGEIKNSSGELITIYYSVMEKLTPVLSREEVEKTRLENALKQSRRPINISMPEGLEAKIKLKEKIQQTIFGIESFILENIDLLNQATEAVSNNSPERDLLKIRLVNKAKSEINIDPELLEEIKTMANLNNDWFNKFIEEYMVKFISGKRDLFVRNLGITSYGYLSFFDPYAKDYEAMKPGDMHWK